MINSKDYCRINSLCYCNRKTCIFLKIKTKIKFKKPLWRGHRQSDTRKEDEYNIINIIIHIITYNIIIHNL